MLISDKHGVNPSMDICFICGETKQLILFGKMKGDAEAPKEVCTSYEPCETCKKHMEEGIIFISVRDGETNGNNPYRTGKMAVVKEEAVNRLFEGQNELLNQLMTKRMIWIEDSMWKMIGLDQKDG